MTTKDYFGKSQYFFHHSRDCGKKSKEIDLGRSLDEDLWAKMAKSELQNTKIGQVGKLAVAIGQFFKKL